MRPLNFTVEAEAYEGVKRIARKVAADFERVGGLNPNYSVIFATLGRSTIADGLIKSGEYDPSLIEGKREVYQLKLLDRNRLLICGSDKRGTIYGMFALSEYIGVSPMCYWGDDDPIKKEIVFEKDIETVSKEPSVKYRGFFINDEWPCFGNWAFSHYGGFNADMYDVVFELLLRLKGNCLWPAMWTSSFALDGPGNANEELADIYGIIIGSSHHEPCLRASEEWDKVRGAGSPYGSDWNYAVNKAGLLKYWEDGLKRSGEYEKMITVGMRGERDSSMGIPTLKENIDMLKDIIAEQRKLIQKYAPNAPLLLALYKEVEEYYYGDGETPGLEDWDGLEDVICMLCDDNYGFLRTLPSKPGRYGMYYHLDYHGGPVSYEWLPSVQFEKISEQMTNAYESGIRDIWIVNVGDLKFNEILLYYFMDLAYDFEEHKSGEFAEVGVKKIFPGFNAGLVGKATYLLNGLFRLNSVRRPEAMDAFTFHPCNYLETDRAIAYAKRVNELNEEIYSKLSGSEKDAYYSMLYYSVKASVNLHLMWLYAVKNRHYAAQGKTIANRYAVMIAECIKTDRRLAEEFSEFRDDKWKGMEKAPHIGFVTWNEDNSRYPLRTLVEPASKPRMTVSRKDGAEIAHKAYGKPMTINVDDFLYAGNSAVILEIANDGRGSFDYTAEPDRPCNWLGITPSKGTVSERNPQEEVTLTCYKSKLTSKVQTAKLTVTDGETVVEVMISARNVDTEDYPPMTFFENKGVFAVNAAHFCANSGFVFLKNYGRSGDGMKMSKAGDEITYRFRIPESGEYTAEVWTAPTNPIRPKSPIRFKIGGQTVTAVPEDFRAGDHTDKRWCGGVLNNIRITEAVLPLEKGLREITVGAVDPGLILERLILYKKGNKPKESYLGPPESFYT